jgi:hypothetical protein
MQMLVASQEDFGCSVHVRTAHWALFTGCEEEDTCMSYEEEDTCMSYEENTCMSYEAGDTCMSYEEEDTCMSYEEEDTCHMKRRIHSWLS